ncbi:NUDIX domain-containing protein [Paenibacillus sp. NPDC056579]|uniref:NUDIX domain-containing protein n=1 Tax=Paenibacillus sp. NPDC056579 TaxID=3345871 RepID=UPI003691EB0C
MLRFISELPQDKPIAGVHSVPVLENGNLIMVWDRDEQALTTIGGRVERGETLDEALDREALEEAGVVLGKERIPFACWYWQETNSYTVWLLTRVESFLDMPQGFEKTGYVVMNFPTAVGLVTKLEGEGERSRILTKAGQLTGRL